MKKFQIPRTALLILTVAVIAFGTKLNAQNNPLPSLKAYKSKLTADKRIENFTIDPHRNTPSSISFSAAAPVLQNAAISILKDVLQLRESIDELKEKTSTITMGGKMVYQKYQQYYKGIKVEHGTYTAMTKNGELQHLIGEYYELALTTAETTPILNQAQTLQKALDYVGATKYMWQEPGMDKLPDGQKPVGELVIVEDIFNNKGMRLAYKFNIYASQPVSRSYMYVDAMDGSIDFIDRIIKHINNNGTAATKYSGTQTIVTSTVGSAGVSPYLLTGTKNGDSINTYNMKKGINYAAAVGFSDADNNWTAAEYNNANYDNAALDAQWGAGVVSDYWQNVQGRNSYDNFGAAIRSYVHYDAYYDNAFWNGSAMTYGDGSNTPGRFTALTSLDVCAHEIGHAVCTYTANLAYQRESGALNEGLSDIWGAAIEYYGAPTKKTWLLGEDIMYGGNGTTALRSMSNPKDDGQPDTYLGANWQDVSTAGCPSPSNYNDNCGVHTNSGVINKWFYLITVGGSGTNDIGSAYSFAGLTMAKSQFIVYNTELLLSANATYAACRTASINATTTMYGACSNEVQVVTNAWYAVGVGGLFIQCGTTVNFNQSTDSRAEATTGTVSGCRKYVDYTYRMAIGLAPSAAAIATLTYSGTATKGLDYDVTTNGSFTSPSNDITFGTTAPTPQTFTVRIYDDGNVEPAETIIINYTLNSNGGNATKGNTVPSTTITILDNDVAPTGSVTNIFPISSVAATSAYTTASPFDATQASQRNQYLYTAAELTSAGLVAGSLTSFQLYVIFKNSTRPFTNLSIKMANTTVTNLLTTLYPVSGLITAYSSASYSTVAGWNNFLFSTPFVWNGTSNLAVELCYDNASTSASGGSDGVYYYYAGNGQDNTITQNGINCSAAFTSPISYGAYKPIAQLGLYLNTGIETAAAATSSNNLNVGSNDYFYSANNKLIAKLGNISNPLGCVTATIETAGTMWAPFQSGQRSAKTFLITPTTNGSTTTYNASLYFENAELGGKSASTLRLFKTSAASVDAADASNTVQIVPSVSTLGNNVTVFSSSFTGFSRFFLVDNDVLLPIVLTNFSGKLTSDNNTLLNWTTSSEWNNKSFDIEISRNGTDFVKLGTMASKGNSTTAQDYSYLHVKPQPGTTYYRLKQIDINGRTTYSRSISVNIADNGTDKPSLYPVPAHSMITVNFGGIVSKGDITIYSSDLKMLLVQTINMLSVKTEVDISFLPNGIYFLKVVGGPNSGLLKFIKN